MHGDWKKSTLGSSYKKRSDIQNCFKMSQTIIVWYRLRHTDSVSNWFELMSLRREKLEKHYKVWFVEWYHLLDG